MRTLLSLAALTLLAQETFQDNPTVDKVFATDDGNIFLPHALNLARNHARQEKLEVREISRDGAASDDVLEHIATDSEANERKRQEDDSAVAANTPNTAPLAVGTAVPVEAAAAAQAKGKAVAVKETGKAADKPSEDGKPSAKAKAEAEAKAEAGNNA